MAANKPTIDDGAVFNDIGSAQVEFTADVDDDDHDFAVQSDMLLTLSSDTSNGDAEESLGRFCDAIAEAA